MANLFGSICLSDIPKELITTAKNGKKYLNIEVNELRQPSQYGATHAVKASVRKSERKEGVNYYIGNLKPSKYSNDEQTATEPAGQLTSVEEALTVHTDDSDLPF